MTIFADVETSTDTYANRFSGAVGQWFLKVQEFIALSLLSLRTYTVLDVGGGHGQLAFSFAAHGYKVTVIGSDASCEHRIKLLTEKGQCTFQVGDLLSLPFPDKSFDGVTCIRLLPHCDDWKKLISELCRVTRYQVIVDYPPLRSFNIFYRVLFRFKHSAEGDTRPFTIFEDREIEDVFSKSGFTLEKRAPQFFLPMVLYRKLGGKGTLGKILEGCFNRLGLTAIFGSPVIASFVRNPHSHDVH